MYPHIEVAAEVCLQEADRFLIEGFELATTYPARLGHAIGGIVVRTCFWGIPGFPPMTSRPIAPQAPT
jgi:hypothetical protein